MHSVTLLPYKSKYIPFEDRFWQKVCKTDYCWEWLGAKAFGYGKIGIPLAWRREGESTLSAHRVSWELHFGSIPDGLMVCHKCDNRGCVRPDHLFLGTHKENMDDMKGKGRSASGLRNGMSTHPEKSFPSMWGKRRRLSESIVFEVRSLRLLGLPIHGLCKKYGISYGALRDAAVGNTWKWLSDAT